MTTTTQQHNVISTIKKYKREFQETEMWWCQVEICNRDTSSHWEDLSVEVIVEDECLGL